MTDGLSGKISIVISCQNDNDCILSFSTSFNKASFKIWYTTRRSHSNDSIHSKLELFDQFQP